MTFDAPPIDSLDLAIKSLGETLMVSPAIICIYTGSVPPGCAPMPRDPAPPVGMAIDGPLTGAFEQALRINPAVHDGAVMIGRSRETDDYVITGWSYRLFPPETDRSLIPNRGSAFHSSLLMSAVDGVDRVYLFSTGQLVCFADGRERS